MNNNLIKRGSLACLMCLQMFLAGCCCINFGSCSLNAKYERTVRLSANMAASSNLAAKTHNGSITINGADVTECNVTAKIEARAITDEDAQKVAEETKVTLEPDGKGLIVKIARPLNMRNRSVSVSLDVTTPNRTSLELITHNGGVKLMDIEGQITATTHNGSVTTERTSGTTRLKTHNGRIACNDLSGDIQLHTHNGGIKAYYSEDAPSVCDVSLTTHNGGIEFTAPSNFSAKVDASTNNGSIDTNLAITVIGKVSKSRLTGTIGTGEGKLHLETHNGSIKIR
jgi:hypothetical protein